MGYEADDLLGTVSRQGEAEDYQVYIVTGIATPSLILRRRKCSSQNAASQKQSCDEAALRQNYGVTPSKWWIRLMGDSSDNIPEPSVGQKRPLPLQSYGSIEYMPISRDYANS